MRGYQNNDHQVQRDSNSQLVVDEDDKRWVWYSRVTGANLDFCKKGGPIKKGGGGPIKKGEERPIKKKGGSD